jgi:hypothetical protein
MEPYEIHALVRQVIREELAPILMGKVGEINEKYRAKLKSRLSGETGLENLRTLHPYGLASKPKAETEVVILPLMGDPTNLNVLTQHDKDRPEIEQGEVALYGPDGQIIHFKNDGNIYQGSSEADEPVVLGNVLKTLLEALIDAFLNNPQVGQCAVGPVMLDPGVRTQLTQAKQTYLSQASSNILSQKNFVERGD